MSLIIYLLQPLLKRSKIQEMIRYIKALFSWKTALALFVIFTFLVNALHESYPDEFDNILGGWYIIHGKLPYSGFFTHHGPVPYFIAALITLFGGQSFVRFRILYAIFLITIMFGTYCLLKKRLGKDVLGFYPFFIAFLGIGSTYYWMQMLLADNIAALSFLPVYALVILKTIFRKTFTLKDVVTIVFFSSIGLYSSLTYLYLFLLIHLATLYLYFKDNPPKPLISPKTLLPIFIIFLPHLGFLLYLLVTKSLSDYFYQNYTFNTLYYIYNYPKPEGATFVNPVRYAILIAYRFISNYYILLGDVLKFDFAFPVNITMAVGNAGLVIYLLFRRYYKLATFVSLVFIFTNIRSNPLDSKETDYQAAVYNLISFFNIFFLLPELYNSINNKGIELAKKAVFSVLLLLAGTYAFFTLFHLIFKFNEKTVSKYMGTAPLIYDRPKIAPIVNNVVGKDEYAWIGPFEFEELFYMNGKVPSKYHILIRGVGLSEKTSREMVADFNNNKPKLIMFDKDFFYLGSKTESYSKFFLDFLEADYVTLLNYHKDNLAYQSVAPIHVGEKVDLETKMYIRKDKVDEVVKKLVARGYLREIIVK